MGPEPDERSRLLDALTELSYEVGYSGLTVCALLERAAVSRADFYRYFSDLEDCFCAAYIRARDRLFSRIEAAVAEQPTWRQQTRATAYVMVRFLREDPKLTQLSVVEVRSAGERATLLFTQAARRLFDLLDAGRAEGGGSDSVSRATAESVGGGIFAQIFDAVEQGQPLTEEAVPGLLYAAILPYLGPEAAAEELRLPPPGGAF
jgi:AcrR family transcriptional regulator